MSQSNTRVGDFSLTAGADLRGKEGCVVYLGSAGGEMVAFLPEFPSQAAQFVLLEGAEAGKQVVVRPLSPERNVRVRLWGTCNPGDLLVTAEPAPEDRGTVRALTQQVQIALLSEFGGAAFFVLGIAEEAGIAGQLVLLRPMLTFKSS